MDGENLCLFNRKNLNAILFPNFLFQTPHGTTLCIKGLYSPLKFNRLWVFYIFFKNPILYQNT